MRYDQRSLRLVVLGRLLLVGLTGGAVTGAVVGVAAVLDRSDGQSWELVGLFYGASAGLVLGAVTAVVVAAVLTVLRRVRPATSAAALHAVAAALSCSAAGATAVAVTGLLAGAPVSRAGLLLGLAVVCAAAVSGVTVPWCLRPLLQMDEPPTASP